VIGITASAAVVARLTRAHLDESLSWLDVLGIALLGGIGFTVSLLIGELAFGPDSERNEYVKVGVLTGSLLAAALAAVVLRVRERTYRRIVSG
jgi:NhaA family Na+:H+ antiporter